MLGGICYYWTGKADMQDDEKNEAEETDANDKKYRVHS